MSLLSKEEIKVRILKQKFIVSKIEIQNRIKKTQQITQKLFGILQKLESKVLVTEANLLWQLGHICFFYLNLIFPNLLEDWLEKKDKLIHTHQLTSHNYNQLVIFYDSFVTPSHLRNDTKYLLDFDSIQNINQSIYQIIQEYLLTNNTNYVSSYLIMLGILHQHMHLEALIFNLQSQRVVINFLNYNSDSKNLTNQEITWISYSGGKILQGSKEDITGKTHLTFDNEKPAFLTHVNKFQVSQFLVTEYQYTLFILEGGYQKKEYWCDVSWDWKEKEEIVLPLYWEWKEKNNKKELFVWQNGKYFSTLSNLPICHISFYEAQAYCRWKKVRLPLEKEYEFMATNENKTKYPWGNCENIQARCHLNYQGPMIPVNKMLEGSNNKGVNQLIGNVWEWCQEPIYPYDNFTIDPVYREMSYPYFGEKRICKGGCWAVPDFLIHPRYRNAQLPTCREQFIGFRVCL